MFRRKTTQEFDVRQAAGGEFAKLIEKAHIDLFQASRYGQRGNTAVLEGVQINTLLAYLDRIGELSNTLRHTLEALESADEDNLVEIHEGGE